MFPQIVKPDASFTHGFCAPEHSYLLSSGMSFVYFNTLFTSLHEHTAPHGHVRRLKHSKFNLPSIWDKHKRLFTPGAIVQYSFKTIIDIVRIFDSEWLGKFIELSNQFCISI